MTKLYRRRLIPDECIYLKDDFILMQKDSEIITSWKTLHPKNDFSHGVSYYLIEKGWKISKFFNDSNQLLYIYCDIIDTIHDEQNNSYIFTDLLADVIIQENGGLKVVDLDELAAALDLNILNKEMISSALRRLNNLLSEIYSGDFQSYIQILDQYI